MESQRIKVLYPLSEDCSVAFPALRNRESGLLGVLVFCLLVRDEGDRLGSRRIVFNLCWGGFKWALAALLRGMLCLYNIVYVLDDSLYRDYLENSSCKGVWHWFSSLDLSVDLV